MSLFKIDSTKLYVAPVGPTLNIRYGALYNWYAATNSKNIANTSFHVPTVAEIESLLTFIDPDYTPVVNISGTGTSTIAGSALKQDSLTYWDDITGNTNTYNFNLRGSGIRTEVGNYTGLTANFNMFASDNDDVSAAYVMSVYSGDDSAYVWAYDKIYGASIRLVADSTALAEGEYGTYTGNDGKVYVTCCINGVEWMIENLAETQYRDGSFIPIIEDPLAWIDTGIGYMCIHSNEYTNMLEQNSERHIVIKVDQTSSLNFILTLQVDITGEGLDMTVDHGDGTTQVITDLSANTFPISHTYSQFGVYTLKLTFTSLATNLLYLSALDIEDIKVANVIGFWNINGLYAPDIYLGSTAFLGDICIAGVTPSEWEFSLTDTNLDSFSFLQLGNRIKTLTLKNCGLSYISFVNVIFEASNDNISVIDISDNNMTATNVNRILTEIDSVTINLFDYGNYDAVYTINIGGTNTSPDGTSGGYDGLTAVANLTTKGYTIIT